MKTFRVKKVTFLPSICMIIIYLLLVLLLLLLNSGLVESNYPNGTQ